MSDELEGLTFVENPPKVVDPPKTEPAPEPPKPQDPPVESPKAQDPEPPKPVDPPVQAPAEPAPPQPKDVADLFNDTPAPTVEIPADIQERLNKSEARNKEYDAFLAQLETSNPIFKAIKLGMDPEGMKKVLTESAPVDYSAFGYEQLVAMELKNEFGYQGQELNEAVLEYMEAHKIKTRFEQSREEKSLKDKYNTGVRQSEFLTQYEKMVQEQQANTPKPPTPEDLKKISDADQKMIRDLLTNAKGGKLLGIEMTPERIATLEAAYNPNSISPYVKPDNSIDAKSFILHNFYRLYVEDIRKAAKEEGRQEVMKEMSKPTGITSGSAPAGVGQSKKPEEILKDGFSEAAWY